LNSSEIVIATTTVSDSTRARDIANELIAQSAAACVQIDGPVQSVYRWDGETCADTEWRLTIKTTAASLARCRDIVLRLHPYEMPQWIVVTATSVDDAYARWVADSVTVAAAATDADRACVTFHVHLTGIDSGDLGTDFQTVFAMLDQNPRIHIEQDGSFVWSGAGWQLDGMIYDRNETLRYVDLKGNCPPQVWNALVAILAISPSFAQVLLLPDGGLNSLQDFEKMTWPATP